MSMGEFAMGGVVNAVGYDWNVGMAWIGTDTGLYSSKCGVHTPHHNTLFSLLCFCYVALSRAVTRCGAEQCD
jgi:hypothetical protein